jgi:hypothetical protein
MAYYINSTTFAGNKVAALENRGYTPVITTNRPEWNDEETRKRIRSPQWQDNVHFGLDDLKATRIRINPYENPREIYLKAVEVVRKRKAPPGRYNLLVNAGKFVPIMSFDVTEADLRGLERRDCGF